ncbi:pyridoxamine 5'-phosphate oxidase family protein [Oceanidesulfovibrio indonesiensis]|uniref:Pyridoxamine 5'-phosphate oxidase family protein n=1 Tax=Oceanidesulfovibrio indonesiensis TaxID=54767 RepID=A0A7M3MBY7_9BACT|nr:pyridoxamine 5'-phosphate oxidase family protein [Oceanidesulfovibrio indonesiensis]TVM15789.1 pyridoxamine 5'-phosphate oxidase family protein [Oceanidesulfovibrio indonesiensis]
MQTHSLAQVLALIETQDMAVLATTDGNEPHASLMAYVSADGGRTIYLATGASSTKYRNIAAHPRVSLLVDTREVSICPGSDAPRSSIQALTAGGRAEVIPQEQSGEPKRLFRIAHPHMQAFLDDPDTIFLAVRITDLLLLNGLADATFLRLDVDG